MFLVFLIFLVSLVVDRLRNDSQHLRSICPAVGAVASLIGIPGALKAIPIGIIGHLSLPVPLPVLVNFSIVLVAIGIYQRALAVELAILEAVSGGEKARVDDKRDGVFIWSWQRRRFPRR